MTDEFVTALEDHSGRALYSSKEKRENIEQIGGGGSGGGIVEHFIAVRQLEKFQFSQACKEEGCEGEGAGLPSKRYSQRRGGNGRNRGGRGEGGGASTW